MDTTGVAGGEMAHVDGPYLAMAVICERVLEEKDGVLSAIRMVDRIMVNPPSGQEPPASMPAVMLDVRLVISLKSGRARGRSTVTVRPEKPSGMRLPEIRFPVLLEGEERGANLLVGLNLQLDEEGLYWFDVLFEDDLLSRIPLRVIYQPLSVGTM